MYWLAEYKNTKFVATIFKTNIHTIWQSQPGQAFILLC
jgi:hypothetical protein